MAEAYPLELRERAVRAYESGEGTALEVAKRFSIGEATMKRWLWRHRDHGDLRPTKKGGGTRSEIKQSEIEAIVSHLRDANAVEIAAEYNRHRRGTSRVHVSTIKRALRRFGYVVKKSADGRSKFCAPTSRRSELRS